MKAKNRLKTITLFVLVIPLFALVSVGLAFYVSWSISWQEEEGLTTPRFLHSSLLRILNGEADDTKDFSGILMVSDDSGNILYTSPEMEKRFQYDPEMDAEAHLRDIMKQMPGIPLNFQLYNYNGEAGIVIFLDDFFSNARFFRFSSMIIVLLYFLMIVLPVIIVSIHVRPILNSFFSLESAAREIGKGNLSFSIKNRDKKRNRLSNIREIRSLESAFDSMRLELKENQEHQSRLMLSISHDLKTPLTLIKGYVEALKDGMAETPDQVIEYADVIFDRSLLLEERINDLIHFAKLNTSEWKTSFEDIETGSFFQETAEIFKNDSFIRKRNFYFVNNLKESVYIKGDRKLLFQVLENLFDNSCRYTADDDLIRLIISVENESLVIVMEDSGPGVDEEYREDIFRSFYRLDQGRNSRGLGVGLSSVKTIIESFGGTIEYVESPVGGAAFRIEIPAHH